MNFTAYKCIFFPLEITITSKELSYMEYPKTFTDRFESSCLGFMSVYLPPNIDHTLRTILEKPDGKEKRIEWALFIQI